MEIKSNCDKGLTWKISMKYQISIFLFCFSCIVSFTSVAGSPASHEVKIYDCSKSKNQSEMDSCIESAYNNATKKLGKLVKKLTNNYTTNEPGLKPVLLQAQEKWEAFINSECDFLNYYSRGGSGYNAYFLSCMELHTLKRIEQLEDVLSKP